MIKPIKKGKAKKTNATTLQGRLAEQRKIQKDKTMK
jgi:hypothetical protein